MVSTKVGLTAEMTAVWRVVMMVAAMVVLTAEMTVGLLVALKVE